MWTEESRLKNTMKHPEGTGETEVGAEIAEVEVNDEAPEVEGAGEPRGCWKRMFAEVPAWWHETSKLPSLLMNHLPTPDEMAKCFLF